MSDKAECGKCKWWSIKSDNWGVCLHAIHYNDMRIYAGHCDFGKATAMEHQSIVAEINNYGRIMLKDTFSCDLFEAWPAEEECDAKST